jgi:hypothetical protein
MRPIFVKFVVRMVHATVFALALTFALAAHAHQGIGYNLRAAHFEHQADGLTAYFRLTLPLVVANRIGPRKDDGSFVPAPYTYNRLESGRVFHYLDIAAVRRDPLDLGRLVATGHELKVAGRPIAPKLLAVRVHRKGEVPPFSTLEEAKRAIAGPAYGGSEEEIDSGYVLVDAALFYARAGGVKQFELKSSLAPGELGELQTRNIFWDHAAAPPRQYDLPGLLEEPVAIGTEPAATTQP